MRKRGEPIPSNNDEFAQLNSINSPFVADAPTKSRSTGTNKVWGGTDQEDDFPAGDETAENEWAHNKMDELADLFTTFAKTRTPEASRAYQDALMDLMRDPRKAYLIMQIGIAAVSFINSHSENDKDNDNKGEGK